LKEDMVHPAGDHSLLDCLDECAARCRPRVSKIEYSGDMIY
jgi:hypothetical protein